MEFIKLLPQEVQDKILVNLVACNERGENYKQSWLNSDTDEYGVKSAFSWDITPEGYDYWNDIDDKMESLRKELQKRKIASILGKL